MNEIAVPFTLDELWYMRSRVRHVIPSEEQWRKYPPASEELNEAICDAILIIEDSVEEAKHGNSRSIQEYHLTLSKGDCLLLDYVIDQDAATATGVRVGRTILLKVMAARRQLAGGPVASAEEPEAPDVESKMEEWTALRRRPRRRATE